MQLKVIKKEGSLYIKYNELLKVKKENKILYLLYLNKLYFL